MTDDTETSDAGRIIAFKNPAHEPGSKQPAFKGTIHLQGSNDKRPVALWVRASKKTGETFLTGKAAENATTQIEKIALGEVDNRDEDTIEQAQTNGTALAVDPHEVVLFKNAKKAPGSKQPDYFGYYNPGDSIKLQRLDVWARNDKYGKPMLSGGVKAHEPKQENTNEQTQDSIQEQPAKKKRARAI